MKLLAAQTTNDLADLKVNPLEAPAKDEWIPPFWIGAHVGKRLVDGMRVLQRLPMSRAGGLTNAWPAYYHEYSERSQYEDDETWKSENAKQSNQIRLMPSSVEIARMEQTLVWPARYLRDFPQLLLVVSVVAHCRSRDLDLGFAARRRLHLPTHVVRKWHVDGLERIARGLIRDRVPVF